MDLSKLSRGQLIAGAGGILLVLSLFLGWVSVFGGTQTAFDAFSGMDIIMLVIGAAAVAFAAVTATETSIDLPRNASVVLAVLGVLVVGWALGWVLEEPSAGFGAWLGLIGAGAIAYGGWEAHRAPTPMAASRPARPAASSGSQQTTQSMASTADATASAADAAASAAAERTDTKEATVERPVARRRPEVAPGGEADTIAPRPATEAPDQAPTQASNAPDHPDAGASEPGGG